MNKRIRTTLILASLVAAVVIIVMMSRGRKSPVFTVREVYPHVGTIRTFVSTTGTILPKNRLEIKPPINGRVEKILVSEGDRVRAGQTLIWMSSTDRAALIDAARAQGSEQLKYWQEVYRPIPLVAPISGTVIVRSLEPGQTALTTTAILVLSDYLQVEANVDETDIGRVRVGQKAELSLEAYPDVTATGKVTHIKYESTTVNNVTTYEVDIMPDRTPAVFRSGMTANINIIDQEKNNVLLLPDSAIQRENGQSYVLVRAGKGEKSEKRVIQTGLNDDQHVEIVSGLSESDTVLIVDKGLKISTEKKKSNPFLPKPPRGAGPK